MNPKIQSEINQTKEENTTLNDPTYAKRYRMQSNL